MKMYFLIPIALVLSTCSPLTQSSVNSGSNPKTLVYRDFAYEEQIRSITIHPAGTDPRILLQPAVTKLGEGNLMLEFDDLVSQRDLYYAKVIHCNYNWTKSILLDLDFLSDYNEFPVNTYDFSLNSHIPFTHYRFTLPLVKLPGNYLLIVYRGGDKSDLVLSKRFMVYDTQIGFQSDRNLVGAGSVASLNQQMNFTLSYKSIDIINPLESVHVNIRQNQRWDNLAEDIRPSFVREIDHQIEYRFFDDKKMFKGGNEFRFFDLRSLISPGRNVASVDKSAKPFEVYIQKDKVRTRDPYSQYLDMDGGFIIDNYDYQSQAFANYAYVNFTLASPKPYTGDVYVAGAFNYWNNDDNNRMYYDSIHHEYQGRALLRQGFYDYQYVVQSPDVPYYQIEGTHYETENQYEVFVYYRPFNPKADLLLGYMRLSKNPR
jgi:hypothetical protein